MRGYAVLLGTRITLLDAFLPFALLSGTSLILTFYLHTVSPPSSSLLSLPLYLLLSSASPPLNICLQPFPPLPPACHNQLGFLETKLLLPLLKHFQHACPLPTELHTISHLGCPHSGTNPENSKYWLAFWQTHIALHQALDKAAEQNFSSLPFLYFSSHVFSVHQNV